MNLTICGIDGQVAHVHKDLKVDFVIADPPLNDSGGCGELLREDKRWQYGVPPSVSIRCECLVIAA